jgi:protocatechuate 3,4-dioxygenase beta subunit
MRGFGQGETDAEGRYRIENLAEGEYQMMITAKGYMHLEEEVEGPAGGEVTKDVALKGGIVIAGTVIDGNSRKSVAGAVVINMLRGDEALMSGGVLKTRSAENGAFRLEGVAVGDIGRWDRESRRRIRMRGVILVASKEGWVQTEPQRVEVNEGQPAVEGVEVLLFPSPRATGRIVDANGVPVAGARIVAVDPERSRYELDMILGREPPVRRSGKDGTFDLPVPPGERVFLVVAHPGYAFAVHRCDGVTPGRTVKTPEIRLSPGGTVAGTVLDEGGNPVPGKEVEYRFTGSRETQEFRFQHPALIRLLPKVRTDEKGRFVLKHMMAGSWRIMIRRGRSASPEVRTAQVRDGESVDVAFRLAKPLSIAGVVIDAAGVPVGEGHVWVSSKGGGSGWGRLDEKGAFTIKGLRPGVYDLHVNAAGFENQVVKGIDAGMLNVRVTVTRVQKKD